MRVIEGEGKRAAQQRSAAVESDEFTPLVRFDLSLGSFIKEYMKLENQRKEDDRLNEGEAVNILLRFAAGVAVSCDVDDEMFLKSADILYQKELENFEREGKKE